MDKYTKMYDETRKRIFDLLDERGMSQKDLANKLNVSSQTITDWKKGKSNSFLRDLNQIACALQTTHNWLFSGLGEKDFSDEQRKELEKQERLNIVAMAAASNEADDQLKLYVKNALQQKAREIGISFSELLSRNSQLVTYLGVTPSDLLGEEKELPTVADEERLDQELIERLCQLSPEELEKVDAFVQGLLAAR